MTTASSRVGNRPTKSITNAWSDSAGGAVIQNLHVNGGKAFLCGALTASTWKTVINITGKGACPFLAIYSMDSTARGLGLRVTVDGVVVFTGTCATTFSSNTGMFAVGLGNGLIRWNKSLVVEALSTVTETDKVSVSHILFIE